MKNIKYVFLGNSQTLKEIGDLPKNSQEKWAKDSKAIFERYCKANNSKYEQRNRVSGGLEGNYYFTIAPTNIFYLVLAEAEYSEGTIFEMIDEIQKENIPLLVDEKKELNKLGYNSLKTIVDRYQNPKSKISAINNDINDIQVEMKQNIKKAMNNLEDVQVLDERANRLQIGASEFKKDAVELKKVTCFQNAKWTLILIILVIGVLLVIILPIALSGNNTGGTNSSTTTTTTPTNTTNTPVRNLTSIFNANNF